MVREVGASLPARPAIERDIELCLLLRRALRRETQPASPESIAMSSIAITAPLGARSRIGCPRRQLRAPRLVGQARQSTARSIIRDWKR